MFKDKIYKILFNFTAHCCILSIKSTLRYIDNCVFVNGFFTLIHTFICGNRLYRNENYFNFSESKSRLLFFQGRSQFGMMFFLKKKLFHNV